MQREKFSSRLGFLLISAGCAIGLGNVWRFPYITGMYGGAAFETWIFSIFWWNCYYVYYAFLARKSRNKCWRCETLDSITFFLISTCGIFQNRFYCIFGLEFLSQILSNRN